MCYMSSERKRYSVGYLAGVAKLADAQDLKSFTNPRKPLYSQGYFYFCTGFHRLLHSIAQKKFRETLTVYVTYAIMFTSLRNRTN